MEFEPLIRCDASKNDFSDHGCWYCRKDPERSATFCLQPCVKRLRLENDRLKKRIVECENKLKEIRNEV